MWRATKIIEVSHQGREKKRPKKKEKRHKELFQLLCESRWRVKEADRLLQMAGAAAKKALTTHCVVAAMGRIDFWLKDYCRTPKSWVQLHPQSLHQIFRFSGFCMWWALGCQLPLCLRKTTIVLMHALPSPHSHTKRKQLWIWYLLHPHRITKCFELVGTFKSHLVQTSCSDQGHPQLGHIAQSLIQHSLDSFQGWEFYHLSGQPVPIFHHPHCKNSFSFGLV